MYHRYGRHGDHAWLRRRKYRYGRRSMLSVPTTQVAVVHVQIPINAERIIIIMAMPEGFDPEQFGKELQIHSNFGGTNPPPPYIIAEHQSELPDGLNAQANIAARKKALQDIENDPENVSSQSQSQLRSAAEMAALEHVGQYIETNIGAAKEYDRFIQAFVNVFLVAYTREIKEKQNVGIIFDDRTLHIRRVVRADKEDHTARGKHLSPEHLRYLATARAMKDLGFDTALSLEDLEKIHQYVEIYCPYYVQYTPKSKEVGQFRGSAPF